MKQNNIEKYLKETKNIIDSWLKDETLQYYYCGDDEEIKKEFIRTIQKTIGTDFIIITKDNLEEQKQSYANSMLGLDY